MIKSAIKKFRTMSAVQRTEFIVALILTVGFLVAIQVYAWFSTNGSLETMTKIKEPGEIIIRAGKADPIVNFEMKDIDIEMISKGTPQKFVFSVMPGDYNMNYDLQLAHTTNIPFEYKIYKAEATDISGMTEEEKANLAIYYPKDNKTDITYYKTNGNELVLNALNYDNNDSYGREIANTEDSCYSLTYDTGDIPEIYAVPVYLQTQYPIIHPENATDPYDYFILELSWKEITNENSAFSEWNDAKNNKETDIIYITVSKRLD